MFGRVDASNLGGGSRLDVEKYSSEDNNEELARDKSAVFRQLKIFGLDNIKSISEQVGRGIKEKTRAVFSRALSLVRGRNGNNLNSNEVNGQNLESTEEVSDNTVIDVPGTGIDIAENDKNAVKDKSDKRKEDIFVIKSFEVTNPRDLFFDLKNVYLEMAEKKGVLESQGGKITEEMLAKFAMNRIAEFEERMRKDVVRRGIVNENVALDFIRHQYELASLVKKPLVFRLVEVVDGGRKKIELRSDNFFAFVEGDKFSEKEKEEKIVDIDQFVDDIIQERGGSSRGKKDFSGDGEFLKIEEIDKFPSAVPTSLNKILFGIKKQTGQSMDLYNDYYEVFGMKAREVVDILHKISRQGNYRLDMGKAGLLNEIIYSIGEPSRDESFEEYLNKYLWGKKLASVYDKIINMVKNSSEEGFRENISNMSAKKIFDVIATQLNRLDSEVASFVLSLKIKKLMPSSTESLGVYFSRLAAENKSNINRSKNNTRIVNFLQEIAPKVHRIILLDREKTVQQNKNNDNGSVRNNKAVEVPYYSYG